MRTTVFALVALSVIIGLVDPAGPSANPSVLTVSWVTFDVAERHDP